MRGIALKIHLWWFVIYVFVFPLCSADNSATTCPALQQDYVKMSSCTSGCAQPGAKSTGRFEYSFPLTTK